MKSAYLIYNPIAGVKNSLATIKAITKGIEHTFTIETYATQYAGHATLLAQKAVCCNITIVIICGGDGSINEVAQSLVKSSTALAIVPMGSGNGLARHLNIPFKADNIISYLLKNQQLKMDVGKLNNTIFVGVAGLGFDSFIGKKFADFGKRGFWTYFKLVVKEYRRFGDKKFEINLGEEYVSTRALLISFANSSQFGNNAYIAPHAEVSDGKLILCILKRFPIVLAPWIAFLLFSKQIKRSKYYQETSITKVRIKQRKKHAHLDGEPHKVGRKIKVKVIPNSLNIVHNLGIEKEGQ